ncbi:hypothetical protein GCM10007916_23230 [Psychromonas marina]|uniref:DUF3047 domain-containing protein n=1 Tax=Psychromonas marina TaxID=88364 RepID=A0ABQ6E1Y7_9GAMM|nr:DUF3047 domain-containing protein [Psychromonas marina]GLS91254.1 hypothetical protein GCM10007916_23230 [Psychromonas marina]
MPLPEINLIRFIVLIFSFLITCSSASANQEEDLYIGKFSQGDLDSWQLKKFDGNTHYQIVTDEVNGKQVLMADSHNSASGLYKEQRIDLQKTPYLHWSWKTDKLYSALNENEKQGDDFVARIYIVIDGGVFFWKTRALNYVWSSTSEKHRSWKNPYTANAIMFSVESGDQNLGQWINYQRNVRNDLKVMHGIEVRYIDAVAVMTDTDNSGQHATSYYGDIYFSAKP